MRLASALAVGVLMGWVEPGWAGDDRQGLNAILQGNKVDQPPEFNIVHFCHWRTAHQTFRMTQREQDAFTDKCVLSEAQSYEDISLRWRAVDYRVKAGCVVMRGQGEHPSYAEFDECLLDK